MKINHILVFKLFYHIFYFKKFTNEFKIYNILFFELSHQIFLFKFRSCAKEKLQKEYPHDVNFFPGGEYFLNYILQIFSFLRQGQTVYRTEAMDKFGHFLTGNKKNKHSDEKITDR